MGYGIEYGWNRALEKINSWFYNSLASVSYLSNDSAMLPVFFYWNTCFYLLFSSNMSKPVVSFAFFPNKDYLCLVLVRYVGQILEVIESVTNFSRLFVFIL